mgnify:CR=1 FL=1
MPRKPSRPPPRQTAEPPMNGKTVPRMTNRHMITVRDMPVPSITIVWTGITAVGGITIAMIASKIDPARGAGEDTDESGDKRRQERPANGWTDVGG